jgi:acetyl-CoA carboxylase carboxyltransferase component
MYKIESKIDLNSPAFKKNKSAMEKAVQILKERLSSVKKGGPEYMHKKHTKRGKMCCDHNWNWYGS